MAFSNFFDLLLIFYRASNYGTFASVVGQSITSFISSIDFIFDKISDDDDDWPQDMKNEYLRRFHDFEMQLNNYSKTYGLSDDTRNVNYCLYCKKKTNWLKK